MRTLQGTLLFVGPFINELHDKLAVCSHQMSFSFHVAVEEIVEVTIVRLATSGIIISKLRHHMHSASPYTFSPYGILNL